MAREISLTGQGGYEVVSGGNEESGRLCCDMRSAGSLKHDCAGFSEG